MNKARAMLDALMGPSRDIAVKDKGKSKEKFKDPTVCKPFLVGMCACDQAFLGGKRNFAVCEKIHSEIMKEQFEAHGEREELQWEYELACVASLEFAVRECDGRIANEKARIRDDWGRRRPPLPSKVIDVLSKMKRESSAMFKQAEELDDDQIKEKEALVSRSAELMKDAEAYEEVETKKAIAAAVPEEVCECCGTAYQGDAADKAHQQFKIHIAYEAIRKKLAELQPKKADWEKKKKEKMDEDAKKKRAEDWKKDAEDDEKPKKEKDSGKDRDRSRGRSKDRSRGRGKRDDDDRGGRGGRNRRDKNDGSRDRGGRDRRGRSDSRGRSRSKGRYGGSRGGGRHARDDSRSRRRR